jgi:O-methyltransferase
LTITKIAKQGLRRVINKAGYEITLRDQEEKYPPDFTSEHISIRRAVRTHTLGSPESTYTLIQAVTYIVGNDIPGSIVECGVWRGGSMMTVALALNNLGRSDRELYLYDTFDGMPAPGIHDVNLMGETATSKFAVLKTGDDRSNWVSAALPAVQLAMMSTHYEQGRLHFVAGKVEDTIPVEAPKQIALLRLDTDFYESTRHELVHLFPRLSPGGILLIDDYGHWRGAKKAVDEYFASSPWRIFLQRVDYTCRLVVKPDRSTSRE